MTTLRGVFVLRLNNSDQRTISSSGPYLTYSPTIEFLILTYLHDLLTSHTRERGRDLVLAGAHCDQYVFQTAPLANRFHDRAYRYTQMCPGHTV